MNMSNKYFQCLIFPIIPIVFTLLWLIFAGYETNISVLLSKPNIRIFPLLLAGISLFYLFLKCKEYTNKYIRILFFLIAILALLFPYIESAIIKNMHLIFAYATLVLYVYLIKDMPQFFQYRMLFYLTDEDYWFIRDCIPLGECIHTYKIKVESYDSALYTIDLLQKLFYVLDLSYRNRNVQQLYLIHSYLL